MFVTGAMVINMSYIPFQGILPPLLTVFTKTSRVSMTRNAVWCLSNLCRGKNPPPDFEKVSPALQVHTAFLIRDMIND